jgi:hypothetical protein
VPAFASCAVYRPLARVRRTGPVAERAVCTVLYLADGPGDRPACRRRQDLLTAPDRPDQSCQAGTNAPPPAVTIQMRAYTIFYWL